MPWMIPAAIVGGSLISKSGADSAANTQAGATGNAIGETSREYNQTRQDLAPYRQAGSDALTRLRSLLGLERGAGTAVSGPISSDQFDANAYRAANPDVAANGMDPYQHYVQYGMNEGRQGYKLGDFTGDVQSSPLLRKFTQGDLESDVPYNSGLQFGLDEGRKGIERRAAAKGGYDSGAALKELTRFGNDYGAGKAEGAYNRFVGNQGDVYGRLSGIAGMGQGATNVGVNAGTNSSNNLASLYSGLGNAQGAAQIAGANAITGGINNASSLYYLNQLNGGGQRSLVPEMAPGQYSTVNRQYG